MTILEGDYAGRLSKFVDNWSKITQNFTILSWLSGYKIPFSIRPKQIRWSRNAPALLDSSRLEESIKHLISIGAVSKTLPKPGQFLSPFFLVPKPCGAFRFILNLKALNNFLEPPHFKLEDFRTVFKLIYPNCYFTKLDLKDAYFMIPVHKNFRKYLFCFSRCLL